MCHNSLIYDEYAQLLLSEQKFLALPWKQANQGDSKGTPHTMCELKVRISLVDWVKHGLAYAPDLKLAYGRWGFISNSTLESSWHTCSRGSARILSAKFEKKSLAFITDRGCVLRIFLHCGLHTSSSLMWWNRWVTFCRQLHGSTVVECTLHPHR